MKIIVFDNILDCGEFYNYLEFNLKHLHEVKTHNYTNMQQHPTDDRYCIFIEFKDPYIDAVTELTKDLLLTELTEDWKNKIEF